MSTVKKNLVLIGFMGTGKTTVGKAIARELRYRFVDTDRRIEEKTGRTIPEIFAQEGETRFREIESEVVQEVSELPGLVIATGGGVVVRPENMERLRASGFVVCLKASAQVIRKRVSRGPIRPLLSGDDPDRRLADLLKKREPEYEKADLVVDTSSLSVGAAVKLIRGVFSKVCEEAT
jgi:shikimate kinase